MRLLGRSTVTVARPRVLIIYIYRRAKKKAPGTIDTSDPKHTHVKYMD